MTENNGNCLLFIYYIHNFINNQKFMCVNVNLSENINYLNISLPSKTQYNTVPV